MGVCGGAAELTTNPSRRVPISLTHETAWQPGVSQRPARRADSAPSDRFTSQLNSHTRTCGVWMCGCVWPDYRPADVCKKVKRGVYFFKVPHFWDRGSCAYIKYTLSSPLGRPTLPHGFEIHDVLWWRLCGCVRFGTRVTYNKVNKVYSFRRAHAQSSASQPQHADHRYCIRFLHHAWSVTSPGAPPI